MKTAFPFLACALGCAAQTTVHDTSLLKAGNAWTYSNFLNEGTIGSRAFDGVTRFRILERWTEGDSLRLRVAREDSGRLLRPYGAPVGDTVARDSDVFARDTTAYTFHAGAFTPGVPPFAAGQLFGVSERLVIFRGDTLPLKGTRNDYCGGHTRLTLEGIGVVEDSWKRGCGSNSGSSYLILQAFNGVPFAGDSVVPVALRSLRARLTVRPEAGVFLQPGRMLYDKQGQTFDLKGQRIWSKPTAPPTP